MSSRSTPLYVLFVHILWGRATRLGSLAGSWPSEDGNVGVYAKMMWFVRTVRGAILVALAIAVATSASYLMSTTRSVPGAAMQSEGNAAQVANADLSASGASPSTDAAVADVPTADQPSGDHPVDLSADLVDAQQAAPRAADSEPTLAPTVDPTLDTSTPDSSEIVQLAAPAAPDGSADSATQGTYKRSVIANLAYGTGASSIGLSLGSDKHPVGPSSFAVDSSGNLLVSDNVNGRVQVFSSQGSLVRSLKVDTYVYDLAAGSGSDLYLLGADGSVVVEDAVTGIVKAEGATAGAVAEELGQLRVSNGQLTLESPRQVAYPLGVSQNGGMALLSSQEQQSGEHKGAGVSQDRYTTSYRDGGHVYRLDDNGNIVQDIALRLPDVESVVFLQEDRAGNIYVQVERASDNGQVSVEVRQLSKKGDLITVVPIDRVDYVPMTRSTVVTEDGTIYQLVPTARGVALVKYQRS